MSDEVAAEREARIRHAWTQWNEGIRDPNSMGEVADDFVLESALTGRTFHGKEGLVAWFNEIDDNFDSWQLRIDDLRDVGGDRFLVLGGVHLRGHASGVEFDQPIGWVLQFAGERVSKFQNFASHEEAIAAVEG